MTDAIPAPATPPAPAAAPEPVTGVLKAAWVLAALGLLFIMERNLLPALVSGLVTYSLVHMIARRVAGRGLSHHKAKLLAVAFIGSIVVAASTALVLAAVAFLRGKFGSLPELLDRMAGIIEGARERYGWEGWIPAADVLREAMSRTLRDHSLEFQKAGGEVGRIFLHAVIGAVIGALASFEARRPQAPLSSAILGRITRLGRAFENVVFAQVRISALNTAITGAYLLVFLPLFGIDLPLRKTLVVITFLVGLIPVLGNLFSNTAIVVIALGTSPPAALASLVFLVVIHKLEYFLNARIVGRQIHAASWEILLAMLIFEAAFGLPGVILAPIAYAYLKGELHERGLI